MKRSRKLVVWFNEVIKNDIVMVGGKGANLGEITNAEIPAMPGFIVTAQAYLDFIEKAKLQGKIKAILKTVDVYDKNQLQDVSSKLQKLIIDTPLPYETAGQIIQYYNYLGRGPVAVRSSATAEDLPEASIIGQQATFFNMNREGEIINTVQVNWASLFSPRAIFYRRMHGVSHLKVGICVLVQSMAQSASYSVMPIIEPVANIQNEITVIARLKPWEALHTWISPYPYTNTQSANHQVIIEQGEPPNRELAPRPSLEGEISKIVFRILGTLTAIIGGAAGIILFIIEIIRLLQH